MPEGMRTTDELCAPLALRLVFFLPASFTGLEGTASDVYAFGLTVDTKTWHIVLGSAS